MPIRRDDPYPAYNFEITITGVSDDGKAVKGSFTEISGLEMSVEPIEYRNGSEDITVRKVPGLKSFPNLVCKRGYTGDLDFWNWVYAGASGQVKRTDMAVIQLNENREEVARWLFRRAWPCKFTGPGFNATGNEVAMETVEICHEGLDQDGQQLV